MATRSTFIYSAAALRRMMGLPASVPIQIREFVNAIWVWVKGDLPTFISKTDFKRHFVERRKADAEPLQVTDWLRDPPRYTVTHPATGSQHWVLKREDRLDCDCEDYRWQQQFIGRGCCKHGYAVLQHLGFNSLQDFVQTKKSPEMTV
ncbi:MAG: SWIM zinc finger family protein [Leptolyngbyaceae cyanobacterium]